MYSDRVFQFLNVVRVFPPFPHAAALLISFFLSFLGLFSVLSRGPLQFMKKKAALSTNKNTGLTRVLKKQLTFYNLLQGIARAEVI
jgi:hypothetical protein